MRKLLTLFTALLFVGSMWGATTYEQLTSIANIDEEAEYVLGIDGTGFHYSGTSSWGLTALPSAQTPIKYTLKKDSKGESFTAQATISDQTYYLQVPTSNTFSMATSAGTNTDLIIGTTQISGTNYAVANKSTTARHLRINGTSGLRSYAGTTGTMAFFYKVVNSGPSLVSIAVSGTPTTTTYEEGDVLDVDGLVVTGTYSVGDPATISEGIKWKARTNAGSDDAVALENYRLTQGQTSLQVQATVSEIASAWFDVTGLTVNEHVVTPGSYDIALNNTFFGCSTGNIAQEQNARKNDVTFVAGCASSAQTKTYYDAAHVRFYKDSYLEISVPDGFVIDTIIFTADGNWSETGISANTGTYDSSNKKWTGEANEVDFSFTAQCRVGSVHIHYAVDLPALTLSTNALDFGSVVKDASVAAKTFTLSGKNLEDAHAVTLVAPTGFTVSPTSITPSSGSIAAQTITVTPNTSAVGTFDGNLTISSDDLDADSIVTLTFTVTAAIVNVTSVELDKSSISIEEGETETLTATVLPVDATNKAVTWESSDEDVATVEDGVVTAVAKGTATITCKSVADPTKLAICEVTVTGPDVVLDFTTNVWEFSESPTKTVAEGEYTDGEYTVKVAGSAENGYYFDKDNLMIGKLGSYLALPVFATNAIAKIVTLGVTGGTASVTFNVFQGETAVSTGVTSCKEDQTFIISPKKVNTEHIIKVTNAQNVRFSKILIYFGEPDPIYAVNCAAAENGSVSADKANACAGETVTLTLTPDAGYKVASVSVNGGDPLDVTENQATFVMPAAVANVVASFSVATAIDNTETSVKAVKVLRNGVLYIEKNGRIYNAMGQIIK